MTKPNYYAILPAEVRYDNNLTEFEKLLYAEITALTDKEGYCYAGNNYFAKLYDKSVQWVSMSISNLIKLGYLYTFIDKEGGNRRKIFIGKRKKGAGFTADPIQENLNTLLNKTLIPYSSKVEDPIQENLNISIQDYQSNISKVSKKVSTRAKNLSFDEIINAFTQNEALRTELVEFVKMRKLIKKPLTSHGLDLLLTQKNSGLFDLCGGDNRKAISIVQQSTAQNWAGFFPLREDSKPRGETKNERQNRVIADTFKKMREEGVL